MKNRFSFTVLIIVGLWLAAGPARAQLPSGHYLSGSAGILAGSLPDSGIYVDDLSLFSDLRESTAETSQHTSTFINEPRLLWISKTKLLGANYGLEVMIPWAYQQIFGQKPATSMGPRPYQIGQFEAYDLEISPLELSWHLTHFDVSAGYAVWVPTDDNAITLGRSAPFAPPQYHWWAHQIMLGGTWYPDAGKKWAVSSLNHYQINQPFNIAPIADPLSGGYGQSVDYGQLFTTEWGLSRTAGEYFNLGFTGNYAHQTTATRESLGPGNPVYEYNGDILAVGPEIKVSVPKYDFSVSLRYLRTLNNPEPPRIGDEL